MAKIKLTNNTLIYNESLANGLNVERNLLNTTNQTGTYTATEDCFVMCRCGCYGQRNTITIDGVLFATAWGSNDSYPTTFMLKKGQSFSWSSAGAGINWTDVKVFGLK